MSALLIAEFKSKREAELVAQLIGNLRTGTVLQRGKNLEELYFAELIAKGAKEKGTVPLSLFKKQLLKRAKRAT
jgi:hypothetical protein